MITMGGYALPSRTIREMIVASVDVIIQAARLRDGSRRITHITEVMGMEGDVIITQDLFVYDILGEDAQGKLMGRHRSTGIGRPRFWDRARYFGEEQRLAAALDVSRDPRPAPSVRWRGRQPWSTTRFWSAGLVALALGGLAFALRQRQVARRQAARHRCTGRIAKA